jgi:hypothetical protein
MRTAARALSVAVLLFALRAFATWAKKMSAPEKQRPTLEVLQQSWAWRQLAYKQANWEQAFLWADAWNILLDDLLDEKPQLRWMNESDVA